VPGAKQLPVLTQRFNGKSGVLVLFVVLAIIALPVLASASVKAASRQSQASLEVARCSPGSPELTTGSGIFDSSRIEPAFNAVTLTRQRNGLRVSWTLATPLSSSTSSAGPGVLGFLLMIFKESASTEPGVIPISDLITALQISESSDTNRITWEAGVGLHNRIVKVPVAAGDKKVTAFFPFSLFSVPITRSFNWTASELASGGGQFALEACPTPAAGYAHDVLGPAIHWSKADLQPFPPTAKS
jgi:hypothetical protein